MIANELHRAGSLINKNDFIEGRLCIERCLELVWLSISCIKNNHGLLKELCRFKELLCGLFISGDLSVKDIVSLEKVIVSLSRESWNSLYPFK
jgi:hypothetical protein